MRITNAKYIMKRGSKVPDGKMYLFEELEEFGINFPIQLYIPYNLSEYPDLVVVNRTPPTEKENNLKDAINNCLSGGANPIGRLLSYNFGNICMMPVIPRTIGVESSYLGYKIYNNIFDEAYNAIDNHRIKFTKEDIKKYENLHNQICNMIIFIQKYLRNNMNIIVDDKVIMTGYSAGAKFSMFFSALHPELIKSVIAGGTGGNNILPDKSLNLLYPLGVSDIPNFNFDAFKNISQFYFIGDYDYNDLTTFKTHYEMLPENERVEGKSPYVKDVSGNNIPKRNDGIKGYHDVIIDGNVVHIQDEIPFDKLDFDLDEKGNYQLGFNGGYYTLEQVKYIIENIGSNPQERFDKIKEIYDSLGINATFKKYESEKDIICDHQGVFLKQELYDDISKFYNQLRIKELKNEKRQL